MVWHITTKLEMVIISQSLGGEGNRREQAVGIFNCVFHDLLLPKNFRNDKMMAKY